MKRNEDSPHVIQSIWHKASVYTKEEAADWCEEHDFTVDVYRSKDDDEGNVLYHIHAQFDPDEAVDDSWGFISETFPDGISASVCQRKEKVMRQKVVPGQMVYTKGTQSADDPFEFIMSDETVDRMGDIIVAKGWQLDDFQSNPIALGYHKHDNPIGTWENVRIVGKKLRGKLKLAAAGTSAEIDTIRSLLEQRILKAVSVGFMPEEYEPIDENADKFWGPFKFLKTVLHECSVVAVPANPNALAVGKSFGIEETRFRKLFCQCDSIGQNAAPLAKIEKALGTASLIAGRPISTKPVH